MNEEWALAQLRRFVDLTRTVYREGYPATVGSEPEVVASAQVVEKILERVLPTWRSLAAADAYEPWSQHHQAAIRAVSEIETMTEVRQNLGDDSPGMTAGAMHHWVWVAAKSLWQSGHYGEAVTAATRKVNAELQNKVGRRDIGEVALFQQSFSADPPSPGKLRLRPRGDDGGATSLSLRRGIVSLAEGVYAGLRNPASHDLLDITEQVGLERLAAVSLLARWVDECDVVAP